MKNNEWTTTVIRLEHKGYQGGAERHTDGTLQGYVLGLENSVVAYEGQTLSELAADFEEAVDEYLADCAADGIEAEMPQTLTPA